MLAVTLSKSIGPEDPPTEALEDRRGLRRLIAGAGLTSHVAVESNRDALRSIVGSPFGPVRNQTLA
jgi:hypothetical protein